MRWDWIVMRKALEGAFLAGGPQRVSVKPRRVRLGRIRADRVAVGPPSTSRDARQRPLHAIEEELPAA